MPLWIVRHARPLVAPGVCYGALDIAADPVATAEAAQALAQVLPQCARIGVSPLQRCQQLARALQILRPELHFLTDSRLREMDFGCWEGIAWDAIPQAYLQAWTDDFAAHRFGGIESASDVLTRVASAWDAYTDHATAAWITHAGVARAAALLQAGVRKLSRADQWPQDAPAYGEWCVMPSVPIL